VIVAEAGLGIWKICLQISELSDVIPVFMFVILALLTWLRRVCRKTDNTISSF
jgi:hypothetical protein